MNQLELVRHSNFNPKSLDEIHAEHKARRKRFASKAIKELPKPRLVERVREVPQITKAKPAFSKTYLKTIQEVAADKQRRGAIDLRIAQFEERIERQQNEWYARQEIEQESRITMKQIGYEVVKKYTHLDLVYEDLFTHRRDAISCFARHEVFYRCRMETIRSLPEIGKYFGGKDHTSILHGIRKYKSYQDGAQLPKKITRNYLIDPSIYMIGEGE